MTTVDILNSHPVTHLRREIGKTNLKGYSKMSKAEVVALMMKNSDRFNHIEMYVKPPRKPRVKKEKKVSKPASKPQAKQSQAKQSEPLTVTKADGTKVVINKKLTVTKADGTKIMIKKKRKKMV